MNLAEIKKEINEFDNETIQIADGFDFNQKDLLKKIIYYYNSRFLTGSLDDQNDRKYFFNIVKNPCDVATKAIDFDTKHIQILTASGGSQLRTWFFERDLKFWFKDQNFGKVLNRIFYELPIFGSVVIKVIDGKPYFVDLRNFAVQQDADTLDKASYIIETHIYNPLEFEKIAKERGWSNYEGVTTEENQIKVYERYGEDNGEYRRTLVAEGGNVLAEDVVEKHPYWEFHFAKINGRWLGIGRVELLLDNQVRINELTNQQVKSSYWSSLRVWQTRDEGVNRNLMTDVENGQILNVESEITQVDMADRNLTFSQAEINRWLINRDEVTFAREVLRGERGPAGATLGAIQIAAGQAGAYFSQIQENIGLDVKEFLYKVIIPQSAKENSGEHILRIAGKDLDKINNLIIGSQARSKMFEFLFRERKLPSAMQFDLMKGIISERVKRGKEQLLKMPAGFYKNIKYKIDIVITGEAMDTREKAANVLAIMQLISVDPNWRQDPVKKQLVYHYMELGGLPPMEFEPSEEPQGISNVLQGRGGGGISRPAMPAEAVPGTSEKTL